MVEQNAALLRRSVRDNIAYGREDLPQAMIQALAAKAHADGFIPGFCAQRGRTGYDAHVGERGGTLSRRPASAHRSCPRHAGGGI
jgi:ATP-binding cassette subfamily B multidrug efflux pump